MFKSLNWTPWIFEGGLEWWPTPRYKWFSAWPISLKPICVKLELQGSLNSHGIKLYITCNELSNYLIIPKKLFVWCIGEGRWCQTMIMSISHFIVLLYKIHSCFSNLRGIKLFIIWSEFPTIDCTKDIDNVLCITEGNGVPHTMAYEEYLWEWQLSSGTPTYIATMTLKKSLHTRIVIP